MSADETRRWLDGCRGRASVFYRLTDPTGPGPIAAAHAVAAAYDTAGDVPALLNHIDDLNKAIDRIGGGS